MLRRPARLHSTARGPQWVIPKAVFAEESTFCGRSRCTCNGFVVLKSTDSEPHAFSHCFEILRADT
jgi:hypothetical protein